MASSILHTLLHPVLFLFFLLPLSVPAASSRYPAIFAFGNSLTDTGNLVYFIGDTEPAARLPYGETYFHYPSGRYSDGRLVIDFIAQALRHPLVPPYRAGNSSEDFKLGANFAVAGACALDNAFFAANGINVTLNDYSFNSQLKWFKQLLLRRFRSVHSSKAIASKSLFFLGEMGVNDYTHLLLDKNGRETIRTYVPIVVHAIGLMVNNLIHEGAKSVIVSGIFPMGCCPLYLTVFQTKNATEYDPKTGCLKWLNKLAMSHNLQLQKELDRLRQVHPKVNILYADYYDSMMPFFNHPKRFGLKAPLVACCGGNGPYNFSLFVPCGTPNSTLCSDPSSYVSWDGLHLTEAAYSVIAHHVLHQFRF